LNDVTPIVKKKSSGKGSKEGKRPGWEDCMYEKGSKRREEKKRVAQG
jgi:hypothetical protein